MHRHSLLALTIAACLLSSQGILAQDKKEEIESENDTVLDEMIVTGTRVSDRTVGESLSPIDLLPASELKALGSTEINAALARTLPSFNFPRPSISDGTDHIRPAQLRGLAPDQTLVLINGKRRHTTAIINVNGTIGRGSSPVDLNAIPVSAIDRIEVLRDGASAQYGSDAIAGVINVVLKGDSEARSVETRYGIHDAGDGELIDGSASYGFGWGDGGYINLAAEYRDRGGTNRAGEDTRQQYPEIGGQADPREATFNRNNHWFGDSKLDDALFFINAKYPFNDNAEFYGFGNISQRDGVAAGFYRRALDARNLPAIYPDGFLPLITSDSKDTSLVSGLRGTLASGWGWDVSLNYGANDFDYGVENSLNVSLGPSSQTSFYAGSLKNSETLLNVDFVNGFQPESWNTSFTTAVGGEYRRENYEIGAGESASYVGSGAQVFPGFRPSDEADVSRHSFALYGDVEAEFTEVFSASAALRYEDYSDFGSTSSGKLSARYAFSDRFALRSTISTGFRAPSLAQQNYSTTATNFINGEPFDVRTFPVNSALAIALGAEPLQAEESTNFGIGFVAQPIDDLSITLDAYRVDIDDRIILSENLTGAAVRAFLTANGFPNTDGGRYFTNAVDTRTKGFDLVARYNLELAEAGALVFTGGYNRTDTDITRIAPNPVELTSGGLNLQRIGRVEQGRITVGAPDNKWILGVDWSLDRWSARLGATRYGEYTALNATPSLDQTFGAEWVLDASVGYEFTDAIQLTVGADNFNDAYPDRVIPGVAFSGILLYSRGEAPFGFNGAFYYAKLGWNF